MKRQINKVMYLSLVFFILACDSKDKRDSDSAVEETTSTDSPSVINSDEFLTSVASSGLMKIEAAKIAHKKGRDDMIKIFASHMIKVNLEINKELDSIIGSSKTHIIPEMSSSSLQEIRKLDSVNSTAFDAIYIRMMVDEYKRNVALYKNAANLQDVKIREFVNRKLQDIEADASMANDVQFNLTNKYAHFSK